MPRHARFISFLLLRVPVKAVFYDGYFYAKGTREAVLYAVLLLRDHARACKVLSPERMFSAIEMFARRLPGERGSDGGFVMKH